VSGRSIVGYDGSEPGRAALDWALAQEQPLVITHVADADAGLIGDDYGREVAHRAETLVAEALAGIEAGRAHGDIETAILDGPVAWALARHAAPGDTLVIGTHKTGFLHGRVLGSRSVEVAMLAACDVMVVPTIDLRFRSGVVAGVADEPGMRQVVEVAARAAARRGEELLLLHSTGDRGPGSERELFADAVAVARETVGDLVVRTRASNRHTAELLLDAARGRALLVLGSGSGDRTRSPIGSVLHDVLLNITAPTLVTHAPEPAAAAPL